MITEVSEIDDLYVGMPVRWEWKRKDVLKVKYDVPPEIRPIGRIVFQEEQEDFSIRLYDYPAVEIPAAEIPANGYRLLASPLFNPKAYADGVRSDLVRRLSSF